MESNSESPIIIQMLKNVKQIIDVSKARGCWKDEELKEIVEELDIDDKAKVSRDPRGIAVEFDGSICFASGIE